MINFVNFSKRQWYFKNNCVTLASLIKNKYYEKVNLRSRSNGCRCDICKRTKHWKSQAPEKAKVAVEQKVAVKAQAETLNTAQVAEEKRKIEAQEAKQAAAVEARPAVEQKAKRERVE